MLQSGGGAGGQVPERLQLRGNDAPGNEPQSVTAAADEAPPDQAGGRMSESICMPSESVLSVV